MCYCIFWLLTAMLSSECLCYTITALSCHVILWVSVLSNNCLVMPCYTLCVNVIVWHYVLLWVLSYSQNAMWSSEYLYHPVIAYLSSSACTILWMLCLLHFTIRILRSFSPKLLTYIPKFLFYLRNFSEISQRPYCDTAQPLKIHQNDAPCATVQL
jgi:hypothetical protein